MIKLGTFIDAVMKESEGNGEYNVVIKPTIGDRTVFQGFLKELQVLFTKSGMEQKKIIEQEFGFFLGQRLDTFDLLSMRHIIYNDKDKGIPEYNRTIEIRIV